MTSSATSIYFVVLTVVVSHSDVMNSPPSLAVGEALKDFRAGQPILAGRSSDDSYDDQHDDHLIRKKRSSSINQLVCGVDIVNLREFIDIPKLKLLVERAFDADESLWSGNVREIVRRRPVLVDYDCSLDVL